MVTDLNIHIINSNEVYIKIYSKKVKEYINKNNEIVTVTVKGNKTYALKDFFKPEVTQNEINEYFGNIIL